MGGGGGGGGQGSFQGKYTVFSIGYPCSLQHNSTLRHDSRNALVYIAVCQPSMLALDRGFSRVSTTAIFVRSVQCQSRKAVDPFHGHWS